jgi:hypothetical protein
MPHVDVLAQPRYLLSQTQPRSEDLQKMASPRKTIPLRGSGPLEQTRSDMGPSSSPSSITTRAFFCAVVVEGNGAKDLPQGVLSASLGTQRSQVFCGRCKRPHCVAGRAHAPADLNGHRATDCCNPRSASSVPSSCIYELSNRYPNLTQQHLQILSMNLSRLSGPTSSNYDCCTNRMPSLSGTSQGRKKAHYYLPMKRIHSSRTSILSCRFTKRSLLMSRNMDERNWETSRSSTSAI